MSKTIKADDSGLVIQRRKDVNVYDVYYQTDRITPADGWCEDVFEKLFGSNFELENGQKCRVEIRQHKTMVSFVPHKESMVKFPIFAIGTPNEYWKRGVTVVFSAEKTGLVIREGISTRAGNGRNEGNKVGHETNIWASVFDKGYWTIIPEKDIFK